MQYQSNRKVSRKVKWSSVVRMLAERVFTRRNVGGMLGLVALIVLVAMVKPDSPEPKQVEAKQVEVEQGKVKSEIVEQEAKPAATVEQEQPLAGAKSKAGQVQSSGTLSKVTYYDYVIVKVRKVKFGKEWYGTATDGTGVFFTDEQMYGREAKVGDVVRCCFLPQGQGQDDMFLLAEVIKSSKRK